MVELSSSNLAGAKSNSVKKMTQQHYNVDYGRLSGDIQTLEEFVKAENPTGGDRILMNEAVWVLKKWLDKPEVIINFSFNERGELESSVDETVIDGIRIIKKQIYKDDSEIPNPFASYTDASKLAGNTGLMNIKYLKTDGYMLVIDLSSVLDALAFEYNSADEIDPRTVAAWTEAATVYTVNDGKIIGKMLKHESGGMLCGQLADCIRDCKINSMCPKIKLGNKSIVSYMGENVQIAKLGISSYKEIINTCANEITTCVLGKIGNSNIASKIKWLGLTNNCEYAIEFAGDNLNELIVEFSIIAKVFMRKYRFEPDIYVYNKNTDRFVKCPK